MARKKKDARRFLFEEALTALNSIPGKSWNYRQLASALGLHDERDRQALSVLLEDFVRKGLAEEVERGKYRSKDSSKVLEGKVDTTQSGAAYISSAESKEDIFVAPRYVNGALHGDLVKVKVFSRKRKDGREEGEIIEIVQRSRSEFVGTIHFEKRFAFFTPDNKKFPDFIIPNGKTRNAEEGQKVVVKMASWEDFSDLPRGEVVSVLGQAGENETEINAIMIEYGLPYHFPKDVEAMAGLIKTEITQEEISKRRDFRNITTFTIDPFDAKDFDDALSIQKLENGNWEIGVHIADVSHYVKPGSILDKEAYERATSVYLVDRVVPMLPEVLSNFVCSLRPDEEKLTFSAVFEMDEHAAVKKEWFGRTVIKSARRFNYEEVQEILEGKSGDFKEEIHVLDRLAKKLRAARFKNGSITFEKEEVKFHLDENANPTGVYFKVMKDSNQLIEDFMLLANRRVAEYASLAKRAGEQPKQHDLRRPFVYRVHNSPDPERVAEFSTFVRTFGYRINAGSERALAESLNSLLKDVQGKPEANMIETLAVRTMAKAIYTTENIGHYGLGFSFYTHFTSPIRRYPDVLVHRLLQYLLDADSGKNSGAPPDKKNLEQQCKHCSDQEKLAAEAERASIKYKQVQFLLDKVGQQFEGIISGVTEFGFFVELAENKCEGLVHVRSLKDDRYFFEEEKYCLRGSRSGKVFRLGDEVRVLVKTADLGKKQIDFELAERDGGKKDQKSEQHRREKEKHESRRENDEKFHTQKKAGPDDGDDSWMVSGKELKEKMGLSPLGKKKKRK